MDPTPPRNSYFLCTPTSSPAAAFLLRLTFPAPICVNHHRPMREVISTKDAPQAIGPYSQAIKANGFVFTSGQIALDPATQQIVTGDVAAQTERVLRNLSEILEAAAAASAKSFAPPSS